jgi:acyl-CoA thioester hydrolase
VRVYHEDADASGVVYHANYLRFLERARTEWLRALGFEQTDLAARHQVAFVVCALAIEYLKPAAFNDELAVSVALERLTGGQIVLDQRITRGGSELATARVRIACVNTASFRPVRIPSSVADALAAQADRTTGHQQ